MDLDIRRLKVLDAVMMTGSVTDAACQLHRTQPQVSRILKALEEDLGFELFQRLGRGLVPTQRGKLFHTHARLLLDEADALKRIAESVRRNGEAAVRLASPNYFNQSLLPRIVANICTHYPELSFELVALTRNAAGQLESNREFDVAIAPLPFLRPDLLATPLATVRFVAWLPPGHVLAQRPVLEPQDLLGHPLIGIDWETPLRDALRPFLAPVEQGLQVKVMASTIETACQLVARGIGIAIADPLVGVACLGEHQIVTRPLAPEVSYTLGVCFPGAARPSLPLLGVIADALGEEIISLQQHIDIVPTRGADIQSLSSLFL